MAIITAGTVTVADDGTATATAGSVAESVYDAFVDNYLADTGYPLPTGSDGAGPKSGFATLATRLAAAFVEHLPSFTLTWGGEMGTVARYAKANGYSSISDGATRNADTEHTSPITGKLAALAWNSDGASSDTVMKVWVNGTVRETITLTGTEGVDTTLSYAVAAGDQLTIEYDAGTAPASSTYHLIITPAP